MAKQMAGESVENPLSADQVGAPVGFMVIPWGFVLEYVPLHVQVLVVLSGEV
jgi:hypothetical protein